MTGPWPHLPQDPSLLLLPPESSSSPALFLQASNCLKSYFYDDPVSLALLERTPRRVGHSILMKVPDVQLYVPKHCDKWFLY